MAIYKVKNRADVPVLLCNSSVCFGVFDGLHEGHQFEINECIREASKTNLYSVCVTFNIDPDELFVENFKKLMTNDERISSLAASGVDNLIVLDFEEIQEIEPIDFLDLYFGEYTPRSLHVGKGFKFGKGASGNTELLVEWGNKNNMNVFIHDLLTKNGQVISSSQLRNK